MAISQSQKVDFLLKKIGYTKTKTGLSVDGTLTGTKKAGFAEALPSPLIIADGSVWTESGLIPTTPPGSDTSQVKVYLSGTSGVRLTLDSTVAGNRAFIAYTTYNNTSSARLTNWIDTQFGDNYIIKVYKGDPNSGGVQLSASGSGANDGWFFDYSAGVLNFNDTNVPSGVTGTNIYIVGYRYIGNTGAPTPGDDFTFRDLTVSRNLSVAGLSTFTGLVDINGGGQASTFKVEDLTSGRVTYAGVGGELQDSANLTFDGTDLTVASAKISDLTDNRVVIAGTSGALEDSSNLTFDGTTLSVTGNENVTGRIGGFTQLSAPHGSTTTIAVTVASKTSAHRYNGTGSGSGYFLDGVEAPLLTLTPGRTYRFTNNNTGSHPFKFYLEPDKTTLYTTNVNFQNSYTEITITDETPSVLHYQCTAHGYMGNAIQTNSNVVNTNYDAVLRGGLNVSGVTTTAGLLDINGGGQANTFKVEDLTDNRVVIAGTNGELEDSANLTFDGSTLAITGAATVSTNLTVTGNAVVNGNVDLGDATSDTITATGRFDSDLVPSTDGARDLGASGLEWKDLYVDGTANIDSLVADTAKVSDLTSGRVVLAGTGGEIEDSGNLTFNGSTLAVTGSQTVSGDIDVVGNVSIGGTLTYQDVTNVDSVGIATARTGLHVLAGGIVVNAGVVTFTHAIDANGGVDVAGVSTIANLKVGSVTVTHIRDEDNMASNSDTSLATQQSIKAYVDAQITAQDLDVAGDSGTGSVDLDSQSLTIAGTANEIETSASGQTITVGLPNDVTVGAALTVTGALKIGASATVGITTVLDEDNMASNSAEALATQQSIKAYVDAQTTAQDLDFQADSGGALSIDLGTETLSVVGTSNEIQTAGSGNQIQIGLPDDVTIGGDLTVGSGLTVGAGLSVVGVSTFAGAVDANGGANVANGLTANQINVTGISTFVGVATFTNGDVYIAQDLFVNGQQVTGGGPVVGNDINARNIKATGISTFEGVTGIEGDTNIGIGGTTFVADVSVSRVGINSTAPAYTLDVDGVINSSTDVRVNGVSVSGGISADDATALAIALG